MGMTPDFFEDLRRVGALKRDRLGGKPSDNALSKAPRPPVSRDTVGAWLRGRFPQRLEPLLAVLEDIRAEAARLGILQTMAPGVPGETVADLLAETRWRSTWADEQQRRTQVNLEAVERQKAYKALEDDERRARQAALPDLPRPVRSWTPQRLGVHPAVPGYPSGPHGSGFVLPTYVPRPHDIELRERLAAAIADGAPPLLVVVRGESCTGKTRTAFEALNATVPDDFELLSPTNTDNLLAVLAANALAPRTVLWLNEAQDYLADPAGEAAAAALLRRLDADGPLIVIATLWPDHDETLTAAPGNDDPHRHARTLLAQAHYTFLPRSFADDLDAVRSTAGHDQSLATALDVGGVNLTQALAAGPDLVTHYEHPAGAYGIYGRALISAAMDAYRLRVSRPLPLAFLEAAAPGYLTDTERTNASPDWFIGALAHARTLIKQTTRPLQDLPHPTGMGALPNVVRLADYLQQHGRRTRRLLFPPVSFWNAAAEHLTSKTDLTQLGFAAQIRGRYRHAAELFCAAADIGNPNDLLPLAMLREVTLDSDGAERLYRLAADAGNLAALRTLGDKREAAGDREEAERLYRLAADAGDSAALRTLGKRREAAGDREEAERLYRLAADAGDSAALLSLANLREPAGDRQTLEQLLRASADTGDSEALTALAMMRERAGDCDEAQQLALQAADAGNPGALLALATMREKAGGRDRAERLFRAAANAGHAVLVVQMARVLENLKDSRAEGLYRAAADSANPAALLGLARLRDAAGDREEAERLYHAVGSHLGADPARSREGGRDRDRAEPLPPAETDAEDLATLHALAELRLVNRDRQEAERLTVQVINGAGLSTLEDLARIREESAPEYKRYGLDADGTLAKPWAWPEPRTADNDPA
ncbi:MULTISPECIES: tetratricopeptide repeat protein [unclassified Streptomyces]|uniref:tetratricopeptide repeat protein n=1 Tax=unclassified Streptomyces TaxID=2593676 RepID=UPI00136B9F89|nr:MULTISPECIES: tetratricopeptide repeat protein [unclassified Streptomyces]MYV47077.1 sel1 repeat family protein [Streptomyces sp. SID2888]WSB24471.1 sel1 repeat family protein [Streptomyces sp. NBC_01788]WSB30977.1 sel1 repeat family protein [Streptomyces sp. NBC_01788]